MIYWLKAGSTETIMMRRLIGLNWYWLSDATPFVIQIIDECVYVCTYARGVYSIADQHALTLASKDIEASQWSQDHTAFLCLGDTKIIP